ncbi:MAG TPA: SLC13 family permease, partial [Kribbella sp.]
VDVIAVGALVLLLVVAFRHPRGSVEVLAGTVAAAAVVASGAVDLAVAWQQVRLLVPVVAFLAGILVMAEMCAAEGLFAAVGSLVARASRGHPKRLLTLTFASAAVITATLSLDATVVLLTPVMAAAAAAVGTSRRPAVHACARLANSASLLFPVSNLTNLLALSTLRLSFGRFALVMAPVWLAVILVEYVGQRIYFAGDLSAPPAAVSAGPEVEVPVVPLVVVGSALVAFALTSPLGVQPAWVAGTAALVLSGYAVSRRRVRPAEVIRSAHLSFGVFVLCLGIVVAGVTDTFLGTAVAAVVPHDTGLLALLLVALLSTTVANVVNNLPATLLLLPPIAPLGTTALLAALIGLGVGSGLTYTGSLANLLWRRTVLRHGGDPSAREFHALSAMVTLPAVVTGVVVLWAWQPLIR